MTTSPDHDAPSTPEQREEICALINAAREAISGLGDSIQPLDRYLADVFDAFAEADDVIREAKLEQLNETHNDLKQTVDHPDEQAAKEIKDQVVSTMLANLPSSKEELRLLADRLEAMGATLGEISAKLQIGRGTITRLP